MPAVKTKRISALIESQLPEFISSEYELFSKFVSKYYEAQEVQGGPLDVVSNIQKYADINYYEKSILKQNDTLAATITNSDTTITVNDAQSFPKKNGYIRIDNEIIFYATRTDTQFLECSRGVSGNTSLGDLYEASNFTTTEAAPHNSGQTVYNVSNLFLYALVKNFESQYLAGFPQKYLRGEVDKRTLIKNISKFYRAKGTDSSIKFIFNTLVDKDFQENARENLQQFTWKILVEFDNIAINIDSSSGNLKVGDKVYAAGGKGGEVAKVVTNNAGQLVRVYLRQVSGTWALGDNATGGHGASFVASTVTQFPNGIFYIDLGEEAHEFGDFEPGKYYFAPEDIRVQQNYQIIWDQSHPSNLATPLHTQGHPMEFSTTTDGLLNGGELYYNDAPVNGVLTNYDNTFRPEFILNKGESNRIYYYCKFHPYMSGLHGEAGYMVLNTEVDEDDMPKVVKPETYKPKDFTYKASNADWINVYAVKAKVISGDPKSLIGLKVEQVATTEYGYASATVDNVYADGTSDGEQIYNIVLAPETVNGEFSVSTKTKLRQTLTGTASTGDRINVESTVGWEAPGSITIGDEIISFKEKTITQFIIENRQPSGAVVHAANTPVYKPVLLKSGNVSLLSLGVVYNLLPKDGQPYAAPGDRIQVSKPGFETADPKIIKLGTNQPRWLFNQLTDPVVPTQAEVATALEQVSTDVSAIFADDQYYYITSSSFPSHKILDGSTVTQTIQDQKLLRIIRKQASRTTEVYKTPKRDIGIGVNGVPFYGFRDTDSVRFGNLEKITVDVQGRGYNKPPFVLVDGVPNKARAILSGQVVESIVVDTNDVFPRTPEITVTSGRGADVDAVVTGGKVTSLVINNPGEFYSSPPVVQIRDRAGRGRFASFEATVNTDGEITGFTKIEEGNFYNQDTVIVDIIPAGTGAVGIPELKEWNFNRYEKLKDRFLDTENGYVFQNYNNVLEYGYGYVANPKALRVALNDNINNAGSEPATKTHSPIIGFAYDGNPIYGPFGHEDPLDSNSSIVRMTSSYAINGSRREGPSVSQYPLGSFVNDYTYTHKSGSLDENNGRFCITPEFPKGTYAYFLTIDSNQVPQYPYIIGDKFYSLPVDSNYNSNINQEDIPKNSKKFFTAGMQGNGSGLIANIAEVRSGTIDNIDVVRSSNNFSVNSKLYFENRGTEGSEVEALVSSVKGRDVEYIESRENKVVKLTTIQSAYLFADDTLNQPSSGASGSIVGTVKSDNEIVLRNVVGTFDNTGTFSATIKTFTILLDQRSSYTQGAILSLTDGINAPVAKGEVLEGTSGQNLVKIKVTEGTWVVNDDYFIQSSNLFNTSGTKVVRLTSTSDGLEPFEVNQSVALIETTDNHGLGVGDKVNIDVNPDDTLKTKTYYLRKRLYQEATLIPPENNTQIDFTGIGRYEILNGGADYTPGTYTNVPLTSGSGTGATATFTVSDAGIVSSIQFQDLGSGYARGDYLSVADESLVRSSASVSTARFTLYVGHAGISSTSTRLVVQSAIGYAVGDQIQVGAEVMRIGSIIDGDLIVERAQEGTKAVDHFNGQVVSLYKPRYNFATNFQIFSTGTSGYIQSYDPDTQKIIITYDYATLKSNADEVVLSSSFFDSSDPQRLVSVQSATELEYKFEFSEDNTTFVPNPNIALQEFYKYTFDTSHSSLTGTYFDVSPSRNYNVITQEKFESTILPGNPGAFTDLKFGFGSRLSDNDYQTKRGTDFTNFYYFDRKNVVSSGGAYFNIITDPLQGDKTVIYVTPDRFVYDVPSTPLWDGSGTITYTTTGQFAVGRINSASLVNLGLNYKKVPTIIGAEPNTDYRATATVLFDEDSQAIVGIRIDNKGSNYVNPRVVITKGDGVDATFNIVARQGEIFSVVVDNPGRGYTFAPEVEIIESDTELYAESTTVGVPQSVSIVNNGGAFHLDSTVSSDFTSKYVVSLTNIAGNFRIGEKVEQIVDGNVVFSAIVSEWRPGSNLLKIEKAENILRQGIALTAQQGVSGVVKSIFITEFDSVISSFYDNLGYYKSDRGKLGVSNQKITDSFFYQDYSYVIKSGTPIDQWRDLIKSTTHPAGFKLFGQVDVEATAAAEMPKSLPKASHFSVIQLWDPEKNKITVESTKRVVTQTVQKLENQRIRKAQGSAATSEFLFNELRAFEITLNGAFDGYYDSDGRLQGTTSFQMLDNQGNAFFPANLNATANNLIVSLDGVLQEPGVAFTVTSDRIVFAAPPLGPNQKQTGEGQTDVTPYDGVTFYGKYIAFKDSQYNARYFKKVRNIFQRNGRWIDAANQIERNLEFIIEESIGYGQATHPTLDWATKKDDYQRDIREILKAYDHDLRFGGNVKTYDFVDNFSESTDYDYITNNKTKSLDIFSYTTRLAKLAIRNWDYTDTNVNYVTGSTTITVSDSSNLAVGMYISSGRAYPEGTQIVSIDSATQVTLSRAAVANSGGGGGAAQGVTNVDGTSGNAVAPTNTIAVQPGDTFQVEENATYVVPISFSGSDQATFYWSGTTGGTYYDASNLIASNKNYIIEEALGWAQATYPGLNWGTISTKCGRDLGYMIDAYIYHLRWGGNERLVEFGQLYYKAAKYPNSEELLHIDDELTETVATFNYAKDLMILAMRNALQAGTYTAIPPFVDNTVLSDTQFPLCIEVESTLQTYHEIINTILTEGKGLVAKTSQNPNKRGNWSTTLTYSNINIIGDPLIPASECDDVISSVDSLYDNINAILTNNSSTRTIPDYVDGENKDFELYWEDGTEVSVEEDEDLFLTLNAVLQRPKYTANYPLEDAYYIDRTVIPNVLKFDVAPIWDQDFSAKTVGEPTAVEKVSAIGVGNYKRLTIDYDLVDGVRNGPFLILDVEDNTVQSIEAEDNMYVFLDGVLQRKGFSYTVAGPNIYFNVPIKKEMKIDIRYLYGRDVGQILNIYDFAPDTYFSRGTLEIPAVPLAIRQSFSSFAWMGDKIGQPIHLWQQRVDGTYNVIAEVGNFTISGSNFNFDIKSQKASFEENLDYVFAVKGAYDRTFTIAHGDVGTPVLTYVTDDLGRNLLRDDSQIWSGTILRKTFKPPFVSLSNDDKIRVEGEDVFRKVKLLPSIVTSTEGRDGEQVSNSNFGSVSIETYTGITRGEGLSVIATIENGSVVSLSWNQRSYDPLTQPTAYQYYTPPVLNFIPKNGQGGGASAKVLVSKGQVVSVELVNGGSGYTEAPQVVVARRFEVLTERDIGVSLINVGMNPYVEGFGMSAISTIDTLSDAGLSSISSGSSVSLGVPESEIFIEREFNPDEIEVFSIGGPLDPERDKVEIFSSTDPSSDEIQIIDVFPEPAVVSAQLQSVVSSTTISVDRQITTTVQNLIPNDALSNINYFEVAAYLDVDFDINDTIAYIPDTYKFYPQGYLLVGNEVVYYNRKLGDRFLNILRGENNTTAQFWAAGTYLRQIPAPVSVSSAAVIAIESESKLTTVNVGATAKVERVTQRQITSPTFSVTKEALEVVITPPPGGVVDGYQESAFITDPVIKRDGSSVDLIDVGGLYFVTKRNLVDVQVKNSVFGVALEYIGKYEKTNAGHVISFFDGIFDDGACGVSGLTINEFSTYFPAFTLADFAERGDSSYTKAGAKFNLLPPSIQNPVAITSSSGSIPASITVQDTTYFPSSGYLFTSDGSVIQYTGKSTTAFTGCTSVRGSTTITSGAELVPYTIS